MPHTPAKGDNSKVADQDFCSQESALRAADRDIIRAEERSGTTTEGREELRGALLRPRDLPQIDAERTAGGGVEFESVSWVPCFAPHLQYRLAVHVPSMVNYLPRSLPAAPAIAGYRSVRS